MANNYVHINIRRGTSANWAASDPVLKLGEIAADMDKYGLKVGDGTHKWSELPFCTSEVINDLITGGTDKALSAEQGKELKNLVDQKASKTEITNLENKLTQLINGSKVTVEDQNWASTSTANALSANSGRVLKGLVDSKASSTELTNLETKLTQLINNSKVDVIDNLTSTEQKKALSANQGRVLDEKISKISVFGIGYTVNSFNAYNKPTKITFSDGVVANLTWRGTQLDSISASTGETITMNYNNDGLITGRTVTKV